MQLLGGTDLLAQHHLLQSIEPVLVILRAIVHGRTLDLGCQGGRPFGPGEQALRVQVHRHGKGLGLPRLREHRRIGILGGQGQALAAVRGNFSQRGARVAHAGVSRGAK